MRVITNAGPGVKHDIQRALNVRNLDPRTVLTQEQVAYLDHAGSYEPKPRLRDMDVQGIDQVMIIPTEIESIPGSKTPLAPRRSAAPTMNGLTNTRAPIQNGCSSLRSSQCSIRIMRSRRSAGSRC